MNKQKLIDRLKKNKENCEQFNFFGDDCHQVLDNMIEVIEEDMDLDDAEEMFDGDVAEIVNVLNGDVDVEDVLYPEK